MSDNVMMQIYRAVFDRDDPGVQNVIAEIQTTAREYSAEYADPPLPVTDPKLDEQINSVLGLEIELDATKRSALVNLLVNYHDLRNIKPWGDKAAKAPAHIMVW